MFDTILCHLYDDERHEAHAISTHGEKPVNRRPLAAFLALLSASAVGSATAQVGGAASQVGASELVIDSAGAAYAKAHRVATSQPLVLAVLSGIPVQVEQTAGYDRDLFGYPTTIVNNCNTRAEVLKRDSLTPAQVDPFGCAVVAGDWFSPYDGLTWSDPAELQIDHLVALKEAWDSGAWAWSNERRRAFGNDLSDVRSLRAVTSGVNLSKGDRDPSNWIPPNSGFVCEYLSDWVSIKARWSLSMDESEYGRIRNLLRSDCVGQTITPWEPAPGGGSGSPTTTTTTTVPAPTTTIGVPPNPGDSKNCGDFATYQEAKAWFDFYFPYYGDIANLDGSDNDGLPCESLPGGPS